MKLCLLYLIIGSLTFLSPNFVLSASTSTRATKTTTVAPKTTTEAITTTEEPKEETTKVTTEKIDPTTEGIDPTTEGIDPTTEGVDPTTEGDIKPDSSKNRDIKEKVEDSLKELNQTLLKRDISPNLNSSLLNQTSLLNKLPNVDSFQDLNLPHKIAERIDTIRTDIETGVDKIRDRVSEEASKVPFLSSVFPKSDSRLSFSRLPFVKEMVSNNYNSIVDRDTTEYDGTVLKPYKKNLSNIISKVFNLKQGHVYEDNNLRRQKRQSTSDDQEGEEEGGTEGETEGEVTTTPEVTTVAEVTDPPADKEGEETSPGTDKPEEGDDSSSNSTSTTTPSTTTSTTTSDPSTMTLNNNITSANTKDYNNTSKLIVPVIRRNSSHVTIVPTKDSRITKVNIYSNRFTDTNEITIYASENYGILESSNNTVVIGPRSKRELKIDALKNLTWADLKTDKSFKGSSYSKRDTDSVDTNNVATKFVFDSLTSDDPEYSSSSNKTKEEEDFLMFLNMCYSNSKCLGAMAFLNLIVTAAIISVLSGSVLCYHHFCKSYNIYPRSLNNVYNETTVPLETKSTRRFNV